MIIVHSHTISRLFLRKDFLSFFALRHDIRNLPKSVIDIKISEKSVQACGNDFRTIALAFSKSTTIKTNMQLNKITFKAVLLVPTSNRNYPKHTIQTLFMQRKLNHLFLKYIVHLLLIQLLLDDRGPEELTNVTNSTNGEP